MTTVQKITAASMIATVAAAAAIPAASAQHAAPSLREVCMESVYLKHRPAAIVVGTIYRGEKVQITRYSKTRRYVRVRHSKPGMPSGWVPAASLCAKGQTADFDKTARYSLKIANQLAGGDPGFLYVGGPAKVIVKDKQRAGQTYTLCITPAPIEQPSCRTGRTGGASLFAWSEAVPTQVRVSIDGGTVLSATVRPTRIPA